MKRNPFWCKNVKDYKKETAKWIDAPDMQNYMDLAIFFDSFGVAGNKDLLINLKDDFIRPFFCTKTCKHILFFQTLLTGFSLRT